MRKTVPVLGGTKPIAKLDYMQIRHQGGERDRVRKRRTYRLDVAMKITEVMNGFDRVNHLNTKPKSSREGEFAIVLPPPQLAKIFSEQLHYHVVELAEAAACNEATNILAFCKEHETQAGGTRFVVTDFARSRSVQKYLATFSEQ